jgi:hypothetical protein
VKRFLSIAATLVVSVTAVAVAHEHGAIHLSAPEASVGSTIGITADHLSKNASFKFELRGTLDTYTLPVVKSDAKGTFETHLALPAAAGAGSYSLVLIAAEDGDISARADLTIVPATSPPSTAEIAAHHAEMPGMDMAAMSRARKEMMPLNAKTSGVEWATIVIVMALCVGGGLALVRSPARA